MNQSLTSLYRRFREASPFMLVGHNARLALDAARTMIRFNELESLGLVKHEVKFDESPDTSWMDERQLAEWDGEAYGTVAYARLSDDSEWTHVDSVWGHFGYDNPGSPFENPYVIDEMAAAVEWVESHLDAIATRQEMESNYLRSLGV